MTWNLLEKQLFSQKACLTISSKLGLVPGRKVEKKEDPSSEQRSEPK